MVIYDISVVIFTATLGSKHLEVHVAFFFNKKALGTTNNAQYTHSIECEKKKKIIGKIK